MFRFKENKKWIRISFTFFFILFLIILFFYGYDRFNTRLVVLDAIHEPIVNPLMGWAPWATIEESAQPHTLVYMDLTWKDFEPQEGIYSFSDFEEEQQMARWKQEGKRVVFRFVMDFPTDETDMEIPDWLYHKINQDGEFYDNDYGKGFSPNYSNPILIEHHRLAINALGARYGTNDFFAYIQLGSLGHWGEWHENVPTKRFPTKEIRDTYVYHYLEAFPNTHLLMRRPFAIANEFNLGLYNDMTANVQGTTEWLEWIQNGDDYLAEGKNDVVPMPSGWEKAPIGGEQSPTLSQEYIYLDNLETTLQLFRESHTTFVGPYGPYDVDPSGILQDGINQVLSILGYRLYIERVEAPRVVHFGETINIKLDFTNKGIAPFYYDWKTVLYIYDDAGKLLNTYNLPVDLRTILPHQIKTISFDIPVQNFSDGKYKIGVAVLDPLTGKPSIKFANENLRTDLIQEVTSFEIKWFFNAFSD